MTKNDCDSFEGIQESSSRAWSATALSYTQRRYTIKHQQSMVCQCFIIYPPQCQLVDQDMTDHRHTESRGTSRAAPQEDQPQGAPPTNPSHQAPSTGVHSEPQESSLCPLKSGIISFKFVLVYKSGNFSLDPSFKLSFESTNSRNLSNMMRESIPVADSSVPKGFPVQRKISLRNNNFPIGIVPAQDRGKVLWLL